jgi:glycosyltransferase involved in cell wall biosynthesis
VVATELSGVPELVRPGETGTLVPPADARALAEALAQVQASPDESGRLAEAGRELVLREFDLRTNVTRLAELFERQRAAP